MMKFLSMLILMMLSMPLFAQSITAVNKPFPIEVELEGEALGIRASSGQISNIATVTLSNSGDQTVLCEATFVNGPERPYVNRARLNPGEETVVTQAFSREIVRVRVSVACSAQ
ncbi:hypothetical protein [Halopseudomonas pelagia]|uniref:3-phosphoglycerate kinase n=1 Tax=Halopseudomonas pelagia TaxID=553151 RepID=A0AA91Z773_9GAMM|nr:hypothetical protein [Halopseudomonas pelagia]PCD00714.1 hypothetical protein CO192_03845 [Halopseudomonas pelagia]QFY56995.1 hypothetical protein EAO82_11835 [Halopseudomonas pelagia]